jgi:hypothetical protein
MSSPIWRGVSTYSTTCTKASWAPLASRRAYWVCSPDSRDLSSSWAIPERRRKRPKGVKIGEGRKEDERWLVPLTWHLVSEVVDELGQILVLYTNAVIFLLLRLWFCMQVSIMRTKNFANRMKSIASWIYPRSKDSKT